MRRLALATAFAAAIALSGCSLFTYSSKSETTNEAPPANLKCPGCGTVVPAGTRYCPNCGRAMSAS